MTFHARVVPQGQKSGALWVQLLRGWRLLLGMQRRPPGPERRTLAVLLHRRNRANRTI